MTWRIAQGQRHLLEATQLFAEGQPVDDALVGAVGSRLSSVLADNAATGLHLPLGVGEHIDHRVVREAGVRSASGLGSRAVDTRYSEDLPYAGSEKGARQRERLTQSLAPVIQRIDEACWRIKERAVLAYASQLAMLAAPGQDVMRDLEAHAVRAGHGQRAERDWRR